MRRGTARGWTALVGALFLSAVGVGGVAADSVYHTEQLALESIGGASGSGMVVNIHPNGPMMFASERYALRGAEPNATYTVWLVVDATNLDCAFADLTIQMKAELQTNVVGNGTSPADFAFHPGDIPPCLRNASFPIHWDVTLDGTLTHRSESTIVTLD